MIYNIVIKNGVPYSVFAGTELNLKEIKQIVFVGKKDEHVRIEFHNGEAISLKKDEVKIKHT